MPKQILLADDSNTIGKIVEITFANEDFVVTVVRSGDEALARARANPPDVVLADAGMPGKTGYDLCAELRAAGIQAPVLILTGNFSPYDEGRGRAAGADGNVVKPFETQALIDRVHQLVGRGTVSAPYRGEAPTMVEPAHASPPPARSPTDPSRPVVHRPSQPMPSVPSPSGAPRVPTGAAPRPAAASVSAPRSTLMGLPSFSAGAIPGAPTPPSTGAGPSKPAVPHPTFVGASASHLAAPAHPEGAATESAKHLDAKTVMEMEAPIVATPSPSVKVPLPPAPRSPSAPLASVSATPSAPVTRPPAITPPPSAVAAPSLDRSTWVDPPRIHAAPPAVAAPSPAPASPVAATPAIHAPPVAASTPSRPTPPPRAVVPPPAAPHPPVAALGNGDITARMFSERTLAATIPHDAPKMPRPSLIPNAPMPRPRSPAVGNAVSAIARAAAPRVIEALGAPVAHGPEYDFIVKLSREVIEQIAWEVIPDLAETIIRAELDRQSKERARS